jgi:hypothetical protein
MKTNWKAPILAGLGLVSLAIAIPIGVANAQQADQDPQQRGQGLPPVQGGPPQGGQFRGDMPPEMQRGDMMQRMGGMGGGPAAMVTDNAFLYILQGNQLYKVNKNNLEVVGQACSRCRCRWAARVAPAPPASAVAARVRAARPARVARPAPLAAVASNLAS